jgi:hypothetical protein
MQLNAINNKKIKKEDKKEIKKINFVFYPNIFFFSLLDLHIMVVDR